MIPVMESVPCERLDHIADDLGNTGEASVKETGGGQKASISQCAAGSTEHDPDKTPGFISHINPIHKKPPCKGLRHSIRRSGPAPAPMPRFRDLCIPYKYIIKRIVPPSISMKTHMLPHCLSGLRSSSAEECLSMRQDLTGEQPPSLKVGFSYGANTGAPYTFSVKHARKYETSQFIHGIFDVYVTKRRAQEGGS